jgi:thymidylate synthase
MLLNEEFQVDKSGCKMLEIYAPSFIADELQIFGEPNLDYIQREIAWYESQSLYVTEIPGGTPTIWTKVATPYGLINSNYGWMIFSEENGSQYENALRALLKNKDTRQAEMIYTRPTMHFDATFDGMSDFCCTNSHMYLIRDGRLHVHVKMRSNDAWAGYRNDRAWALHVRNKLLSDLRHRYQDLKPGNVYWTASSLHVYQRDFYLVDWYNKAPEGSKRYHVTREVYRNTYPDSPWS